MICRSLQCVFPIMWYAVFHAVTLSSAWVLLPTRTSPCAVPSLRSAFISDEWHHQRNNGRRTSLLSHTPESFGSEPFPLEGDDEYDDCDDDECEIDWDNMPGIEDEAKETSSTDSTKSQKGPTVEMQRLRLEMSWSVHEHEEDCVVDEPESCGSEECQECSGLGFKDCRFCGGTMVLKLKGYSFHPCPICQQGVEVCKTCKGTGWISPWAASANDAMNKPTTI